jgi:membrane-associated phospholipid phosphatase
LPAGGAPEKEQALLPPTPPARLGATDRICLAFVAVLAALALARHSHPAALVACLAALAGGIVASARLGGRTPAGDLVHDFFPVVTIIALFNLTGPVIEAANPSRWDATFAALDGRLFGTLPAAWMGLLGRPWWLTDAASVAYVSYYFIPVVMGAALLAARREEEFRDFAFTVAAALLLTFASYFLMPTTGPRVPVEREAQVLGGSALSAGVRAFLRLAEGNQLDAFPSGHTTLALVFLACGWRLFPRWSLPLALVVAGIVFSTVYLSLHYVIDVVAGAALAALLPFVLPWLRRAAEPRQRPSS